MKKLTLKHRILLGVLLILLTVIGIFTFWVVRHRQIQERAHTNGMALAGLVDGLESGERITLDNIPFAWDSYFIYEPYTPIHVNPACMERSLLFDHFSITSTYLCFFYNDQLVARLSGRHRVPRVFELVEYGELIGAERSQLSKDRLERLPTGFFQVTDDIALGIAFRTNEDEFESYFNLTLFDSYIKGDVVNFDGATTAILVPSVEINDFRFLRIEVAYSVGENNEAHFVAGDVLFSFEILSPEVPFVVTYIDRGSFPSYAISFADEFGLIRYFVLGSESQNESGSFVFRELVPVE